MHRLHHMAAAVGATAAVAALPFDEEDERADERAPHLSVVIPVWNGGGRLRQTLDSLDAALDKHPFASEIVIVDDHSTDETRRVIDAFRDERPMVVLRNDRNRGKGYSVARGMLAATGAYRVFTDADLAYSARDIERVLRALEDGAEVAIACRVLPDSRSVIAPGVLPHVFARYVLGRAFNIIVRACLVEGVLDTQAGLKGFTGEAAGVIFSRLTVARFGFDLECLYIAHEHDLRLAQVPVTYCHDNRVSTVRIARDGAAMLRDLAKVRLNGWRGVYA